MGKRSSDCFGVKCQTLTACGRCTDERRTACEAAWRERASRFHSGARSYQHGQGDPGPWYENVLREMEG